MSRKPKPTKKELAEMKVLSDLGHSPTAISKKMGKSHHTISKYLQYQEVFNDPEIKRLIEIIRQNELDDLFLLGAKARKRLHDLLDEGDTKVIETTAVMDRSFQQRRLLQNESTMNISQSSVIIAIHAKLFSKNETKDTENDHADE
jgi:hypothetical protein